MNHHSFDTFHTKLPLDWIPIKQRFWLSVHAALSNCEIAKEQGFSKSVVANQGWSHPLGLQDIISGSRKSSRLKWQEIDLFYYFPAVFLFPFAMDCIKARGLIQTYVSPSVVCLRGGERGTCLGTPFFWAPPWGVTRVNFPLFWWKTDYSHIYCNVLQSRP